MNAVVEHQVDLPGAPGCRFRVERAPRGSLEVADLLVDIDLQSFVEPTYGRYTAAVLADAGEVYLLRATGGGEGERGGVVGASVCFRRWDDPRHAHLLTIGIRPGWRGRGLGQRFVGWVLDALRRDGLEAASILVGASNVRAVRIYQDLGFHDIREVGTDPVSGEAQLMLRAELLAVAAAS